METLNNICWETTGRMEEDERDIVFHYPSNVRYKCDDSVLVSVELIPRTYLFQVKVLQMHLNS